MKGGLFLTWRPKISGCVFGASLVMACVGIAAHAQEAPDQTASADTPLSAIDWLSQSVATHPVATRPSRPLPDEDPITQSAASPEITVTPLDAPSPDHLGLLPPSATGLPVKLWSGSETDVLIDLIRAEDVSALPALRDFLVTLLLAEAQPPRNASVTGDLFLARIDKLLDLGAVEPALELLEASQPSTPDLFRRYFDVALLTGVEDRACNQMRENPGFAPTLPARVFCLARNGDWNAAALTLNTARALGDVSDVEDALLSRFLDPDLFEGEPPLPVPDRISPLVFRMREAIGEGLPTSNLPRAFAHADLRSNVGWKAQLDAAERLARHGAVQDSVLLDLYTARRPAASGPVWDRAEAIQQFETALTAGDPGAVAETLPDAWDAMQQAQSEIAFARLFSDKLARLPLQGDAAHLAFEIGLLGPNYEEIALDFATDDTDAADAFLIAVARGDMTGIVPRTPKQRAIAAAFTEARPASALLDQAEDDRLGEALLRTIAQLNLAAAGDMVAVTESLAYLRLVGLEDLARRVSLQMLVLDRSE